MTYAQIYNTEIRNIIEISADTSPEEAQIFKGEADLLLSAPDNFGIGDFYIGGEFVKKPEEPHPEPTPEEQKEIAQAEVMSLISSHFTIDMASTYLSNDEIITNSAAFDDWKCPASYKLGDIRNFADQIWKCAQAHTCYAGQEETHNPLKFRAAWGIYHGRSPETAKPFVPIVSTNDLYQIGDYCTDNGAIYISDKRATNFSPSEYPADWKFVRYV